MAFCPKKTPLSLFCTLSLPTSCSTSELLSRQQWMLPNPASQVHKISLSDTEPLSYSNNPNPILPLTDSSPSSFYIVRDDLLHPLIKGNKARKLDALIPILQRHSVTDVVTCGGCQSAHATALAVSCAERGMRSHLLLRGEQPEIPTGYNLVSLMYGNVRYVDRSVYARREEMLAEHANVVAGSGGCVVDVDCVLGSGSDGSGLNLDALSQLESGKCSRRVVVVREGAGDAAALLGLMRLVNYLSQAHLFGKEQEINFVVDAGTGTTAIGLALGALCLGLPWKVTAIMLADTIEGYKEKERCLISDFRSIYQFEFFEQTVGKSSDSIVRWVERVHPRKEISQQTGVLLDPIYTLAAWEQAILSLSEVEKNNKVVMLHTGGTLGLFGLAQRYTNHFHTGE